MDDGEEYDGRYLDYAIVCLLAIPVVGVLCMIAMLLCIIFL